MLPSIVMNLDKSVRFIEIMASITIYGDTSKIFHSLK